MASASSHRYQSRLFSFIHKQSRFLTNRLNRAWKSLQAATSWIAPIVFYPSMLQDAGKQNLHQLPKSESAPPTVDTPIKQVLLLVEAMPSEPESVNTAPSRNLLGFLWNKFFPKANTKLVTTADSSHLKIEDNNTPSSLVPNRPKVRGIASQISNRLLVLVSHHNEVLDILTSQQQQVLQARIISEVTNWRLQRLLPSNPDTTQQLPARQSWLLAPINVFGSIVNWTQRDKHQGKLSVFPSNSIASGAAHPPKSSLYHNKAKLEPHNLSPNPSITKGFQIQGLIRAAIDYFFGDRTFKLPQPTQDNITNDSDPWLTMSDLFGSEVAEQSLILDNPPTSIFPCLPEDKNLTRSSQELNKYSLRNLLNRWRQLFQKTSNKNSASLSVKNPQITTDLTRIKQQKTSIASTQSNQNAKIKPAIATNSPSLNLSNSVIAAQSSERLEHTPDWIETHATTMGYVKHPLEQLLEWLDLAMLWLENILVKFWHWFQQC